MVLMDSGFRNNDSVLLDTLVRVRVPSCHMVSIATTDDAQEHDDDAAHGVTLRREQAGIVHATEEVRAAQRWVVQWCHRKVHGKARLPTGERTLDDRIGRGACCSEISNRVSWDIEFGTEDSSRAG